ncbi:MAG: M28 family metallopeptidase [Candidatus Binatia bacterium]
MARAVMALVLLAAATSVAPALERGDVAVAGRGLRSIVHRLTTDRLKGRDNDTPESEVAQAALIRRLRSLGRGLDATQRGSDAFRQRFTAGPITGTNLLAVMRGRELPDEYVIVGAHYDHLGTRSVETGACSSRGTPGGAVCNGATDNAAGVAAVLAVGRALKRLPTPPRRSIVLALWDAEEDGLAGSLHYVNAPLVPLARTKAYVNFDILGSDLLPSLASTSFAVGGETGGATLQTIVADAVAAERLGTLPVSFIFGQLRSDYASFGSKQIPTVFFSDSTNGCYHTTGDDLAVVDWKKLQAQSRIAFRTVVALAESASPPSYAPAGGVLATFADAQSLRQVFTTAESDLPLFPSDDQQVLTGIRAAIDAIVQAGPDTFDDADVRTLLAVALDGVAAIRRLGCRSQRVPAARAAVNAPRAMRSTATGARKAPG